MMMKHKKFDFRTAYIDLLLNVLTGIIFLFILTTLLITKPTKVESEGVKKNAQYIVTVLWDSKLDCDVDIWVKDPLNRTVSFQEKSNGIMFIERDDIGKRSDYYYDERGNLVSAIDENKEVWTLRGKLAGEYTVNIHLYSCAMGQIGQRTVGAVVNVPVIVELIKINPTIQTLKTFRVVLEKVWDESTVVNFTLDEYGNVTDMNYDQKDLVREDR
jgi:YD repeat-containing protein